MNPEDRITYFAETDARNKRVPFGIRSSDRSRHMYIIGKTGMGKSTLLENMAIQDIKNGEGMAFIDPHGKTADLLLDYIPQERMKDVLYFAPFDLDYPVSFNVMEDVGHEKRHLVANGLMSAFKKIWVDAWSARMEYILNNVLLALLEYPDATLIGVNRMLVDKEYRKKVVDNITDPSVKAFWTDEFAKYGDRYMQEAGAAIQNKIGQFISNPLVRNIIGQPKSTFDIRKMMDERKIIILNLSKGRVGEANANLLGSMLITKIYLGAMSRADVSPGMLKKLPNFYLYVDEFQSFANESFADILSEARKYKLNLTIAHQYIEQMSEEVRAAVFGNVGSMIVFRVGAFDAEVLEKEFAPVFTQEDMVNLGFVQVYMKLMIDGVTSQPFSAVTLPPIEKPLVSFKEDIISFSRKTFARPRVQVEEAIKSWHEPTPRVEQSKKNISGTTTSSANTAPSPRSSGIAQNIHQKPIQPIKYQPPQSSLPSMSQQSQSELSGQFQQTKSVNDLRETALRSAVSSNYSKDTFTEKTNKTDNIEKTDKTDKIDKVDKIDKKKNPKKTKGPTPENLSALREALATVIKEVNIPKSDVEKNHIKNLSEPQETTLKSPLPPQTSQTQQILQRSTQKQSEQLEQLGKTNTQYQEPRAHIQSESHLKEVPEEILRKILELDK